MASVLFTFNSDDDRDMFLAGVKGLTLCVGKGELAATVTAALDSIRFDPPVKADSERHCGLWVSGQKIVEGSLPEMQRRFQQECSSHSASVVLKEHRGGEWKEIRARRLQ